MGWPAMQAMLLALSTALAGTTGAEPVTINFLHTNDVYEIAPKDGRGGLAQLMTLLEQERSRHEHSITTFGGDVISPSLLSGLTEGAQMIEIYNLLGTDIAVPGNHEFDFGPEVAAERIGESAFPWLGTNVLGADGSPAVGMIDLKMMEVAGYRIGFFGILTPWTDVLSSPGPDIRITPPIATATAAVAKLKEQGAELIVALTHDGIRDDRDLASSVDGIDLILGGHDHDPMTYLERGTLIAKAGYDAHYLLAVDLVVDRVMTRDEEVIEVIPSWRYVSTAGVEPDPEIQAVVDRYEGELDETLLVPIGVTTVELDGRRGSLRTVETNLGDLLADAIREGVGADVALINTGGLRGDRTYGAGTLLTPKDILSELPFGNVTVLIELTGADLLEALENGVSEIGGGRFPQVSGMSYVWDAARPAGSRIVEVEVGDEPLDLGRFYALATSDYVYGGGAGYGAVARGTALIDASGATLMATTVMDYIEALGEVAPEVEGRIKRLN